jgi:hypothetical protein
VTTNIFVLALDDLQRGELNTIEHADRYAFHGLLDHDSLIHDDRPDFEALLERAPAQLAAFPGSVDAIIAHWDFPTSVLAPILAADLGLPAPSLESVLTCEHKYWSRLEQARVAPDVVPDFAVFDPFDDQALDAIDLDYPFWVKPVKAFASQLGFEIHGPEELHDAVTTIRAEIGRFASSFDAALAREELLGCYRTCLEELEFSFEPPHGSTA